MSDGRRAGRAGAGLCDNGVTAPGRRRPYGGDHDSPCTTDGADEAGGAEVVVFPRRIDRIPQPDPYHRREIEAPVRIRCYRHEGIVVANHRRFPGLAGLAAAWELAPADGPALTAPAELPDLRPGETAAVPLPFTLPVDGGEAWLTLRVVTAGDEPSVPRGTEVCAPRIRLRAAAPVLTPARTPADVEPRLDALVRRAARAHHEPFLP
ncbi:hypothetical protein BFF78_06860 [Streptomyces fodineus]|uniref:Beta-galactosidase domain-containing protein n=1 Tax=Streptomyces fodineus TaxID=1904616 RepID=A0A1D7Y5C2_9ACTN|nr:hypothetical protein BFF78_06860 [Streptomyces fodineus]